MNTHSTTSNEGWIEWDGGECPVDAETLVVLSLDHPSPWDEDGEHQHGQRAGDFDWSHKGTGDIIAYRIVGQGK